MSSPIRLSLIFSIALFLAFVAVSTTSVSAQSCGDSQMVSTIYSKFKTNKSLAGQVSHINVVVVNAAVKLQGWADTEADYNRAVSMVSDTGCAKLINVNYFEMAAPSAESHMRSSGGNCAMGTKPCGDVCIPEADSCNISTKP